MANALMFSQKAQIPAASRWWKFLQPARKILLGCVCFGAFGRCVPQNTSRPAAEAPAEADQAPDADPNAWHLCSAIASERRLSFSTMQVLSAS